MLSAAQKFIKSCTDARYDEAPMPSLLTREDLGTVWGDSGTQYVVSPLVNGTRSYVGFFTFQEKNVMFTMSAHGKGRILNLHGDPLLYEGTLLDCELLVENNVMTIWVLDTVAINGHRVSSNVYSHRLAAASLILSKLEGLSKVPWDHKADRAVHPMGHYVSSENIRLSVKPIWYHTDPVCAYEWGRKMFPTEGLVYTPETRHISASREGDLFKWLVDASVDVCVNVVDATTAEFFSEEGRLGYVKFHCSCPLLPNVVYKCVLRDGIWSVRCPRMDKLKPNSRELVDGVIKYLESPLTVQELLP